MSRHVVRRPNDVDRIFMVLSYDAQRRILGALGNSALTQQQLIALLGCTQPYLSQRLQRLVAEGYVTRTAGVPTGRGAPTGLYRRTAHPGNAILDAALRILAAPPQESTTEAAA